MKPVSREPGGVVFYDGTCPLCVGSVQFILPRDPRGRFRFASFESATASRLLGDRLPGERPDALVLLEGDRVWTASTAALRIARGLRMPWPVLGLFLAVPRPIRDWAYGLVAARRHRWFGRNQECPVPPEAYRDRFLP